jgi:hypothetical protein
MDPARNVPRELLWEILEDAHWAPTHGLTQPWRFHVFTGEARQKLGGVLQDLYDRLMPAADQRAEKREKLMSNPCRAPVSIVVPSAWIRMEKFRRRRKSPPRPVPCKISCSPPISAALPPSGRPLRSLARRTLSVGWTSMAPIAPLGSFTWDGRWRPTFRRLLVIPWRTTLCSIRI